MAPVYGHGALPLFALDPGILHLNHGSFGAATRAALDAQADLRRRIEARPTRFYRDECLPLLDTARDAAARALGGAAADWLPVENATAGCNAVLQGIAFGTGDEVLITDQIYGAVRKAILHHAESRGARIVEVRVPLPFEDPGALAGAVARALSPRTRLAVFDHVSSTGALILPVTDLIGLCRANGVPVLIDGAHAAGMLPLDVPALGADWYTANAHKWLCAPKGSALLWAAPGRQGDLHPPVISHGFGQGPWREFRWTGTRDPSAQLVLPEVLAVFETLGGAGAMARNRALALEAGRLVAARLGGTLIAGPDSFGAMTVVALPLAGPFAADHIDRLNTEFGRRYPCDTALVPLAGGLGVRLSAHVYNALEDYDRLAVWLAEFLALPLRTRR